MGRGAIPARDALPRQIRPRRTYAGKPPLEGRWHGGAVTERCAAAQRRRRGSALCTRRDSAASFRCGNISPAELDGEFLESRLAPTFQEFFNQALRAKGSLPSQASGTCGSADCHAHGGLRADVGIGPYEGEAGPGEHKARPYENAKGVVQGRAWLHWGRQASSPSRTGMVRPQGQGVPAQRAV